MVLGVKKMKTGSAPQKMTFVRISPTKFGWVSGLRDGWMDGRAKIGFKDCLQQQ